MTFIANCYVPTTLQLFIQRKFLDNYLRGCVFFIFFTKQKKKSLVLKQTGIIDCFIKGRFLLFVNTDYFESNLRS